MLQQLLYMRFIYLGSHLSGGSTIRTSLGWRIQFFELLTGDIAVLHGGIESLFARGEYDGQIGISGEFNDEHGENVELEFEERELFR